MSLNVMIFQGSLLVTAYMYIYTTHHEMHLVTHYIPEVKISVWACCIQNYPMVQTTQLKTPKHFKCSRPNNLSEHEQIYTTQTNRRYRYYEGGGGSLLPIHIQVKFLFEGALCLVGCANMMGKLNAIISSNTQQLYVTHTSGLYLHMSYTCLNRIG